MRPVGAPQHKAQLHHVWRTRNRVVRTVLDGIDDDLSIALVAQDNDRGMGGYFANFVYDVEAAGPAGAVKAPRPQVKQNNIAPFEEIR
jgi:hypothetical protein